jgi:uncharacterized protein YdeI (YjbR/CyaY-like superfamily)
MTARKAAVPPPTFFRNAAAFRTWLGAHHGNTAELIVGFYKKGSDAGGLTYPEALDEALCFGWIDGVVRALDARSYCIRFTPRKPRSYWSSVNRAKAERLIAARRMMPAGLAAWERRDVVPAGKYSFENKPVRLPASAERTFRANARAWAWFSARPPGYRRTALFLVLSAKRQETRDRRLATLISCSAAGLPIPQLRPAPSRKPSSATAAGEKATGRSSRPAAPPSPSVEVTCALGATLPPADHRTDSTKSRAEQEQ